MICTIIPKFKNVNKKIEFMFFELLNKMSEIVKGGSKVFPNNFKLLEIWFRDIYDENNYTEEYFKEMSESKYCQIDIRWHTFNDMYFPDIFAETLPNCIVIILRNTIHNISDNFNLMKNLNCICLANYAGIGDWYHDDNYLKQHKHIANRSLISEIPDCICELTKLNYLCIECASIKEINPNISKLINLETLYLNSNFIEDVPDEIYELPKLIDLDLRYNKISDSKLYFIGVKLMFSQEFKKIINN